MCVCFLHGKKENPSVLHPPFVFSYPDWWAHTEHTTLKKRRCNLQTHKLEIPCCIFFKNQKVDIKQTVKNFIKRKEEKKKILSWCICERWRSMWNALSDRVSGEEWLVYTLNRPSKTLKPSITEPIDPGGKRFTPQTERERLTQREKENSTSCTKYIVTSAHVWRRRRRWKKRQKKTIQTIYASCYTERHSVWYVGDYCRRILTHNCYKVERKGLTLSSNGNSCTYNGDVWCVRKGLC